MVNKENIKTLMNVQRFLIDRQTYDKLFWDKYFDSYDDSTELIEAQDGFMSVNKIQDFLFIQDFVCSGSGLRLFNKLVKKAKEDGKNIEATVSCGNVQLLNVMLGKLKFKITGYYNGKYDLVKETKHGR